MKKCKECYWKERAKSKQEMWCGFEQNEPKKCKFFTYECEVCEEEEARYEFEDKRYCFECLKQSLDLEEATTISYYRDGEFLGSDDDIDEVIENLGEGVKIIDEC